MPTTLIMDLTMEQGGGRESQVQPPKNVWVHYFDIDLDDLPESLPEIVIENKKITSSPEQRKIVFHDHNWTLEIGDAGLPRPAILMVQRINENTYNYWVYRPGDQEYSHLDWLLANMPNPHRTHGRRWLVL